MTTLWDNMTGVWARTPRYKDIPAIATRIDTQWYAAQERWDDLAAWGIYEEWVSADLAPLGYLTPVLESHDGRNKAARHPAGTAEERHAATREEMGQEIESQRRSADVLPIDLARDPLLSGALDETNAAAAARAVALAGTADEDLASFSTALVIGEGSSVEIAQSLIAQELRLYNHPSMTAADRTALETVMADQQAVVDAGDAGADVPAPSDVVRRFVVVPADGYGRLVFARVLSGGWWYPEWTLYVDRELDVSAYWMAVYGGETYLSTPFLTKIDDGVYRADKTATNLPRGKDFVFDATLCHGHITSPQFAKIRYAANVVDQADRVRWGGVAV